MKLRTGLQIRGNRGNKEVKKAVVLFAKWLRKKYEFPIRVAVYLLPGEIFTTLDGKKVVASFRWPDKGDAVCIRLATGDFFDLCNEMGKDEAVESVLLSFARQIVRYQNWCKTGKCTDQGVSRRSNKMLEEYCKSTEKIQKYNKRIHADARLATMRVQSSSAGPAPC
jgi:hypothetical protein